MGASSSLQAEIEAIPEPGNEIKVFRQMRAEYFRLKEAGLGDAELLAELKSAYEAMVTRTDPLSRHRNGKVPKSWDCPKVRYGKTELMMPIITCGGMRQQSTWKLQTTASASDISTECEKNFQAIVDRSMELGINHFETAMGYGTSEIQFGLALKKHERSSFILQTKITPQKNPADFRSYLELSFKKLQVDYVDIFSFHGVNTMEQLDWVIREGGCFEVIEEYKAAGKIRWIGFSTHGHSDVIRAVIQTGKFDSINIHYQFVGSYHASGTDQWEGSVDGGNRENARIAHSQDMGIFCISPNDKGGMLYKPSKVLADACAKSGITPVEFHYLWQWTQDPTAHTFSVGAARPSDLDEAVAAAKLYPRADELLKPVMEHLRGLMVERLGQDWMSTWWKGLPGAYNPTGVFVAHIVWLWNLVKAWGMYDFARARYSTLEGNLAKFDTSKSEQENVKSLNAFTPGYPYRPGVDMGAVIPESCPNKAKVLEVLEEAHEWLCKENEAEVRKTLEKRGWLASYDLQPDVPFPERK